ncbi:transmembrane protein 216 [Anabrus simplex]|uniref:transmembrane protein 216 n=1 Tax=Anabrus simplex TaxID=316456 RepID=UPI0034DD9887
MVNSSLTYEILLYLNSFYFGLFAFCEFGMGIFKAINLPYPTGILATEFSILFFLCCNESTRIFLASKGNLTRRVATILKSVGLTVPSVLGVVYLLVWQTYILRLEVILCGIQLTFQALETLLALFCLASFSKSGSF